MSNSDPDCRYTLTDLETARAAYQAIEDRWADYSGNNPNKFHSQRRDASARVREIESELKQTGLLPYSPEELSTQELDRLFPDAESRSVVEHEGRFFQIRYSPNGLSRSGNVMGGYSHAWHELTGDQAAAEREKLARTGRRAKG
jgi:hypothetical protein